MNTARPALRVAVWTTGNVIRQAARVVLDRRDLALVGAFARSPQKVGVDVGELCGLGRRLGITATADVDELLGLDLDCVIYSPLHLDVAELARILRAGVNVVTTAELMTGSTLDATARAELQGAAEAGNASLFGSGMNPGFAQLLAGVATGISAGIRKVIVSESVDVSEFVADANFEAMGWGRPRGDAGHADAVRAGTAVFAEAVEVLGQLVGTSFDELRCDVEFAHATEDLTLTSMVIQKNHVAAMDVHWTGVVDGHDAVQLRQRWLASTLVDPAWTVEHGYSVEVSGDPNIRIKLDIWPTDADLANLTKETMHGIGMRITAVPVVNAIPAVCAAPAGIVTYADLPVIASPYLRRRLHAV
ncbi:NAD(P)H-dependent amine dehydrogenase family protein [Frankia nepalensis]|uniref:NAD(P)H-dependent amine dehydrogenase family protein n=1 Tax=Frankia nepalensis TaxID=1836974 RepID=UPI0027DC4EC5|nr:dihydrodipicolinate reductase [Frankia nepalensis]